MFASLLAIIVLSRQSPTPPPAPPSKPPAPTAPAAPKPAEESVALFDGTSLAGWKAFSKEGNAAVTWSVKDGVLLCEGNPAGYIATEKEYESFELTLEWRFDPAKGEGNSGVLLRVQQPDDVWPKSIEAQLHSRNAGDIWNIGSFPMKTDPARTKDRRTVKEHPTNEKPLGEWNAYRIVLDGGKLELYVNGLLQNTATEVKVIPGRIALQSEGAHIEFRNIRLKTLGAKR